MLLFILYSPAVEATAVDCGNVKSNLSAVATALRGLDSLPETEKIRGYKAVLAKEQAGLLAAADECASQVLAVYSKTKSDGPKTAEPSETVLSSTISSSDPSNVVQGSGHGNMIPTATAKVPASADAGGATANEVSQAAKGKTIPPNGVATSDMSGKDSGQQVTVNPAGDENAAAAHALSNAAQALKDLIAKEQEANKPTDWNSFSLLTGVGSVVQGVQTSGYKIDKDYVYSTDIGRKVPEILLGGSFRLPFKRGGGWIEKAFPGDNDYKDYHPWHTFLSVRLAPSSDETLAGLVVGGGYRLTKYFSLLVGYSLTPVDEVSSSFRIAAVQTIAANPKAAPYNQFDASAIVNNTQGALDGFPILMPGQSGTAAGRIYPGDPLRTHFRSGIYFGVGIPLPLKGLFTPGK